jgi:Cupin domain
MHLYRAHDESFYVLEETLTIFTPDAEQEIPAGGCVFFPRGVAHRFANPSDRPVRYLAVCSGGLERFLAELNETWTSGDEQRHRDVLERWESEVVWEGSEECRSSQRCDRRFEARTQGAFVAESYGRDRGRSIGASSAAWRHSCHFAEPSRARHQARCENQAARASS